MWSGWAARESHREPVLRTDAGRTEDASPRAWRPTSVSRSSLHVDAHADRVRTQADGPSRLPAEKTRTGIPLDRIAEVVLCHNGKRSPHDAHERYEKYPRLARDFVDIDVDTGQILPPDDFVASYARGAPS